MGKTKKPKPEKYQPTKAALNAAVRANDFCEVSNAMLSEVASVVEREYSGLVESSRDALEYLLQQPDPFARWVAENLNSELFNHQTETAIEAAQKADEDQEGKRPDPSPAEIDLAIRFLAIRLTPEQMQSAYQVAQRKPKNATVFDREFAAMGHEIWRFLVRALFNWNAAYIEDHWHEMIIEASKVKT